MNCLFIRATGDDDKARVLLSAASGFRSGNQFKLDSEAFLDLPNTPFAYWSSQDIRDLFQGNDLSSLGLAAKQGLATADDGRFVRLAWEVGIGSASWCTFAKGGPLSSFYADIPEVVRWEAGAGEIRSNLNGAGSMRSNLWMLAATERDYFFRPGLTWPVRASRFSPRALPAGAVFSHRGYSAFVDQDELGWTLGLANSSVLDYLFKMCLGRSDFPEFLVGLLPRLPAPSDPSMRVRERLAECAIRGWSLRRSLDTVTETSHAFVVPALLQVDAVRFGARVEEWTGRVAGTLAQLLDLQEEIDDLCFELYEVSEKDRRAVTEGFGSSSESDSGSEADDDGDDPADDVQLDPAGLAADLLSWAVGVAVGRFDVDLATGERGWPVEPNPFDPLPVCSPAMLTGADGLPVEVVPEGYPVQVSPVLVHDPGHGLDLTNRVRSVFEVVFGEEADAWWSDAGVALGAKSDDVGAWLAKGFFDHHLKTHSRSRRKAPILWPLGTRSGSYLVWLYAHRLSADSLFRVLTDVVEPKVRVEEQQLTLLRQEAGPEPAASQRKAIHAQERFVDELRELSQAIEEVAPLWAPDLNDGVVIVLAPLWRLFAHHRVWSKELKRHWEKLAAGDYDWAQLAMHLWPERVVPKCALDRSLAIAHGVEDVFWVQDDPETDKWRARTYPTTSIDQLIADRHNPATAAALQRQT